MPDTSGLPFRRAHAFQVPAKGRDIGIRGRGERKALVNLQLDARGEARWSFRRKCFPIAA